MSLKVPYLIALLGLLVAVVLVSPAQSYGTEDGMEKWDYVTVRPKAHTFYWLYKSYHKDDYKTRPLVLWLQGGPGGSSVGYGNFELIGPLDLNLQPRNHTWLKQANLLFIDNPIGAGYSYVENKSAYTTNNKQISRDLVTFMKTFLMEHPEFKKTRFYIFGQSYGGKMGALFAKDLFNEIKAGQIDCNLAGYAMGNSWISPVDSTITWGPFVYWMSLTDERGLEAIQKMAFRCKEAVDSKDWHKAAVLWGETEKVLSRHTNGVDIYNILNFLTPNSAASNQFVYKAATVIHELKLGLKRHMPRLEYLRMFGDKAKSPLYKLMNGPIRKKLGIIPTNVTWDGQSDDVFRQHEGDFMKPVVDVVDNTLMNTTLEVIVYQGQLDLICDSKAAMDWVSQLKWGGLPNYMGAARKPLLEPATGQTETFVKAYQQFKFYWVLQGGHSAPADAAWASYRMLDRILRNKDH